MADHLAATPARHQAVKTLLLTALDLDPSAREPWLTTLEQREAVMAREVRRLLDAHVRAGAFLVLPDGDAGPSASGHGHPAADVTIGPFTVERELGRGGMGTVYLGSRSELGFVQHVAIKVLGTNLARGAVERLRDERRILAALNHPNIAHFVDGGTTADGLPYLAMEYVDGRPVTAYCDDARLDVPARLRLFAKICGAVHFAHQHLVVHRDIKPSNILVTSDGTPKLLDFGIAKLTEPGRAAAAAGQDAGPATAPVLTPHYASPEQAAGAPVTTATDVYSLGVLLYELVTGSGPYPGVDRDSSPLAVLDAVRGADPQRPSAAAARAQRAGVDDDLDAMVLKALRKAPADRYGSAEQFADDIARYLAGRPVLAHAGSSLYAARKFVNRHRASVGAAIVALLSLAGATGVSLWQARVAQRQRTRAEARFNDVRKLANSFVFEFDETVRDIPGTTAARKLVIARSLGYLEELAADVHDDLPMQRELAAAYQRIGDVQGNPYLSNLGERREAMASYRRALELRERVVADRSATSDDQQGLASALGAVGDLLWAEGDFEGTLVHYSRAQSLTSRLAERTPGQPGLVAAAARSEYSVGQALTKLGRFEQAEAQYARTVAMMDTLAVGGVLPPEVRRFRPVAAAKVADGLLRKGHVVEAAVMYAQSAAALEALVERDRGGAAGQQRIHAFLLLRLADGQAVAGRTREARETVERVLRLQRALANADPNDRQIQGDIALATGTLGGIALAARQLDDARRALVESTAAFTRLASTGAGFVDLKSDYAVTLRRDGDRLATEGDAAAARGRYAEAMALLDEAPRDGEYAPERALVYLRASTVAATTADAARLRGEALTEWGRVRAAGVHTWMAEFGGADRLADAMAAAASGATDTLTASSRRPSRP